MGLTFRVQRVCQLGLRDRMFYGIVSWAFSPAFTLWSGLKLGAKLFCLNLGIKKPNIMFGFFTLRLLETI